MTQLSEIIPLIIYVVISVLIVGFLLFAAWWLGDRTSNRNKEIPYESGIIPSGSARLAQHIPFYLLAIFFIVFDVETAFIFIWTVVWDQLGIAGMIHITFFIVTLLLGLLWLNLKGGLDWGPSRERIVHEKE